MLKFRFAMLAFCSGLLAAQAQTPTDQDCGGAIPICQNVYSQGNSYSGTGNIPNEITPAISCLGSGEKNDVWYTFTVQQPGNVCFTITPNSPMDDYDWAVYNLTSATCADIPINASLEVSCNFAGNLGCNGTTGPNGMNNGNPCSGQNESCFPVLANQTYVVNVSNFSASQSGYTIDFSASTAVIFDNVPPYASAIAGPPPCNISNTLTMNFNENVLCSTVQPSDFQLIDPGGGIHTVTAVTGAGCAAGGNHEKTYTLTFSPVITVGGQYQLALVGPVTDLCGNVAPNASLPFTIGIAVANAGPDLVVCADSASTLGIPLPPSGNTYQWTPATAVIGAASNSQLVVGGQNNPAPLSVTYTLSVTNNGCIGTDQVTVTYNPPLAANFAGSDVQVCPDGTSIVGAAAQPGYTYQWSPTTGTIGSNTASQLQVGMLGNTTPMVTDYIVSVKDVNNCPATDIVQVNFLPFRPANYTLPDSLCVGETGVAVYLNTDPAGTSYLWNFNGGNASGTTSSGPIHVWWDTPGVKTVNLKTTLQGCDNDSSQQVVVSAIPTATFTLAPDVCRYSTTPLTYTGTGGATTQFFWDFSTGNNAGTTAAPVVSWNTVGMQSPSLVVEENGCTSPPFSGSINVHALPVADFVFQNACEDSLLHFNTTATVPGDEVIVSTLWDFGGITTPNTAITPVTAHSYPATGTYNVTHTVITGFGCTDDTVMTVSVYPTPVANFRWEDNCENLNTRFIDLATVTGMNATIDQWHWDFGNGFQDSQPNPSQQYQFRGGDSTYVVELAVKTNHACVDTLRQPVVINPAPRVDFSATDVCQYEPTVFTDLSRIMQTDRKGRDSLGRDFLANWHWELGDSLQATAGGPNPQYVYPYPGTFGVTLTVTSDSGCVSSLSDSLRVFPPPPDPVITDDTVCFSDQALLIAEAPEAITVRWFETLAVADPFHTGNAFITPPVVYPITYYVQTVTEHECKSARMPIVSSLWPNDEALLTASANVVEMPGATVQFSTTSARSMVQYTWDFGDDSTATDPDPSHTFNKPGFFTVRAIMTDDKGCPDVQETLVEVRRLVTFAVPTAFTPNGDFENDEFYVPTYNITQMHFRIFDRWGHVILDTEDIHFRWKGVDKSGMPLPEGIYVYLLEATSFDGHVLTDKGSITLMR